MNRMRAGKQKQTCMRKGVYTTYYVYDKYSICSKENI